MRAVVPRGTGLILKSYITLEVEYDLGPKMCRRIACLKIFLGVLGYVLLTFEGQVGETEGNADPTKMG